MDEQRKNLILILEQKKAMIKEDRDVLAPIIISIQNILERYYNKENAFVKQIIILHEFVYVLQNKQKDSFPLYTRCNTRDIAADLSSLIDSIIDEIKAIGLSQQIQGGIGAKGIQITNTLNQNQRQNQLQTITVEIVIEAVKDELNGKQRKELYELSKDIKDSHEARKKIVEKLKEFGASVSSSIVANMLTNPTVWSTFDSLLS